MHSRFNLVAFKIKFETIMAKSKSFFGLRRGSTKSMTFQVNRGMQITKDRVYDVANPRTVPQMAQRLTFANASKFYKAAVQALFKFAYEDKDANDTDYNAFMRINATRSCCASRKMIELNYPAIGNYILTQGTLGDMLPVTWTRDTGEKYFHLSNFVLTPEDDTYTLGDMWRDFCRQNPTIEEGDIATYVIIRADGMQPVGSLASAKENNALMGKISENSAVRPVWEIYQYRVDFSNPMGIGEADVADSPFAQGYDEVTNYAELVHAYQDEDEKPVLAVAFIVSRPVSASKVLVTTSELTPSDDTAIAIAIGKGNEWKQYCAETYELAVSNLDADAILKGEIIATTKVLTYETPSSTAVTSRTKVTTILDANAINAENINADVTVGSNNVKLNFSKYVYLSSVGMTAMYANTAGTTKLYIPVDGSSVKVGAVYLESDTAAKLIRINK